MNFQEYPPEENPFEIIVVDVTHRCNMACTNCYLPNRVVPDMDMERLVSALERFPRRATIRVAGAEPTMREDLPEIITRIRAAGHRLAVVSNGLKLANNDYMLTLKQAGLRHLYLSMNGADNDEWYAITDNMRCAEKKTQAFANAARNRMAVQTGTILKRGLNEGAIGRMICLAREHDLPSALLRFKNVGALGRYDAEAAADNVSMDDMQRLAAEEIGCDPEELARFTTVNGVNDRNSRLFPIDFKSRPGRGIWIKLTNWAVDDDGQVDSDSKRRGRITPEFKVAPFFEHVQANEGGY